MLVTIPYCERDLESLSALLDSLCAVSPSDSGHHDLLTIRDSRSPSMPPICRGQAHSFFDMDREVSGDYEGWGNPVNGAFDIAANWANARCGIRAMAPISFFFCEPDVVFIRDGALTKLLTAWSMACVPFSGPICQSAGVGCYANGVMVYDSRISMLTHRLKETPEPFDIAMRDLIIPNMVGNNLIYQSPPGGWKIGVNTPSAEALVAKALDHGAVAIHAVKDPEDARKVISAAVSAARAGSSSPGSSTGTQP